MEPSFRKVILLAVSDHRVGVMQAIREVRKDLSPQQTKDLIDTLPQTIADKLDASTASWLASMLRNQSAAFSVEVPPDDIAAVSHDIDTWLLEKKTLKEAEDAKAC